MVLDLSREVQKNRGLHDLCGRKYILKRGTFHERKSNPELSSEAG